MKLLLWPLLGCTSVLLLCEVVISMMSSSTILLMDSFHTLFILMTISFSIVTNSQDSHVSLSTSPSSANAASTSPAEPPSESPPGSHEVNDGSITNEPSSSLPNHETASPLDSSQVDFPTVSATAHGCGVSFSRGRMEAAGEFIARLTLSSLTISYSLDMISMSTDSRPVQSGVWLVSVGLVTLVFKTVVLGLCWEELQEKRKPPLRNPPKTSRIEVNQGALVAEGFTEPGQELKDAARVQSEVDNSSHNGALVLCNPGALRTPESESQTSGRQGTIDQKESQIFTICQNLSPNNPASSESRSRSSFWSQPSLTVCEVLLTPVLTVINSAVQLELGRQQPDLTWKIDLGFSVLALVVLNATTIPQLYKFGRLLLQATPSHISVSDLDRRISGIPGVLAVHELHIWELSPSFTVATVHIQFHASFPVYKCADLILEVTKVLQVGGIGCYTIQPEFDTCTESAAAALPSPPIVCNLTCGKNCTEHMCCSLLEEQTSSITAPSAGETEETPQRVVIENTNE